VGVVVGGGVAAEAVVVVVAAAAAAAATVHVRERQAALLLVAMRPQCACGAFRFCRVPTSPIRPCASWRRRGLRCTE
jgi:hypothetical protein